MPRLVWPLAKSICMTKFLWLGGTFRASIQSHELLCKISILTIMHVVVLL